MFTMLGEISLLKDKSFLDLFKSFKCFHTEILLLKTILKEREKNWKNQRGLNTFLYPKDYETLLLKSEEYSRNMPV